MSLLFVDEQDYDDEPLRNSLRFAERQSQRLTSEASINSSMAQQLASAGHRPVRPDLQPHPPNPRPPAGGRFGAGDLQNTDEVNWDIPAQMPGFPATDLKRDQFISNDPRSGVA